MCADLASQKNKYFYKYSVTDEVCEVGDGDLSKIGIGATEIMMQGLVFFFKDF